MTDITEHPRREGKVYCGVVLDALSRRVVGWSIDARAASALVVNALGMAIGTAKLTGRVRCCVSAGPAERNQDGPCERQGAAGSEAVEALIASGALDELFARVDAADLELTGTGGLIPELIKAAL